MNWKTPAEDGFYSSTTQMSVWWLDNLWEEDVWWQVSHFNSLNHSLLIWRQSMIVVILPPSWGCCENKKLIVRHLVSTQHRACASQILTIKYPLHGRKENYSSSDLWAIDSSLEIDLGPLIFFSFFLKVTLSDQGGNEHTNSCDNCWKSVWAAASERTYHHHVQCSEMQMRESSVKK